MVLKCSFGDDLMNFHCEWKRVVELFSMLLVILVCVCVYM